MSSLEFIKKHVKEWPEGCESVAMDIHGKIIFLGDCSSKHDFCPEGFSDDFFDGKIWTREDFGECDISGRVSTVNRDVERASCDSVEHTLSERGKRYGKFKDGADIMQELKGVMRSTSGWHNLSASQKESLEMIQHKIGRILNGNPNYDDNWIDICGYSKLVADELKGDSK